MSQKIIKTRIADGYVEYDVNCKFAYCSVFDCSGNNEKKAFMFENDPNTWVVEKEAEYRDEEGFLFSDDDDYDEVYYGEVTLVVDNNFGTFRRGGTFRGKIFVNGWNAENRFFEAIKNF
jgi:hypothetical protein